MCPAYSEDFLFHADNDCRMNENPTCKANFARYAYVYGGVLRERCGTCSFMVSSAMIGMYKGNFDLCIRNMILIFFGLISFSDDERGMETGHHHQVRKRE